MAVESPFEFMIQYLKREDIRIDYEEYKLQTETHPDYPSLLSFSDSLSFFNIDNLATRIPKDQYENLPKRFIALLDPKDKAPFLTLVEEKENGFEYLVGTGMKYVTTDSFLEIWSGIVLIAEQTEETIQSKTDKSNYSTAAIMLLLLITGLLTFTSTLLPITVTAFALLSILGVFLASEALKQEFGVKNTISSGVCQASPSTDCQAVINSQKAKFFGKIGLSDVSIIYFVAQFMALLVIGIDNYLTSFLQITFLSLVVAVPLTLYSFYYQYKIAKKWCPVCLGIAGVLYIETTILFVEFDQLALTFNWIGLTSVLLIYLLISSIWLHYKPYIKELFELRTANLENVRFRRNYSLFKNALMTSKKVDASIMSSKIQIGSNSSDIQISMVTNPFCKFCEAAHEAVHTIVKRNDINVGVNLRFNVNTGKTDEKSILLHQGLVEIYENEGPDIFMKAMSDWFETKDLNLWHAKYNTSKTPKPEILKLFEKEYNENAKNELMFTPAILINQQLYPNMYRPADLIGFVSELAEDEDLINSTTKLEVL